MEDLEAGSRRSHGESYHEDWPKTSDSESVCNSVRESGRVEDASIHSIRSSRVLPNEQFVGSDCENESVRIEHDSVGTQVHENVVEQALHEAVNAGVIDGGTTILGGDALYTEQSKDKYPMSALDDTEINGLGVRTDQVATEERTLSQRLLWHSDKDIFITHLPLDKPRLIIWREMLEKSLLAMKKQISLVATKWSKKNKTAVDKQEDHPPPGKQLVISIAGLQRMRIRKLQAKLSRSVFHMHFLQEEANDWEILLKQYIEAVRDYDFIRECVDRNYDPFIISSNRKTEFGILRTQLFEFTADERSRSLDGWETVDMCQGTQRDAFTRGQETKQARAKASIERLIMALFSGSFLVGPMWLMVLRPEPYIGLISTTVFVLAFGVVMALAVSTDSMTVMTATAAYAAVLVVFVGTTQPDSTQ